MISPNTAFEDELYRQFLLDPNSVSPAWRDYFQKKNSETQAPASAQEPLAKPPETREINNSSQFPISDSDQLIPLSSISTKISDNMEASLEIPTATSVRQIPVKALDENRRIINKYLMKVKRAKVSFTHILAWAIVRSLIKYPHMNEAFYRKDGKPHRLRHSGINIGLAIDIIKKDGSRLLLVPNIKNAQEMTFPEFIRIYDELIKKTRNNRLTVDDMSGTTVTLTNPGMIGTTASSPRLMQGQGLILAVGSIDYPSEFGAVRPDILTNMAISKVVTVTSTYDHRIIQGAESAEFLAYMHKLLLGEDHFYDQIFASLRIPFEPIRWAKDSGINAMKSKAADVDYIEKAAHVMLMINAYRVRGHLLASINPLGFESYYYPELDPAYYGFTIWDLDRQFHADDSWPYNSPVLRDIIELLRQTYCGAIGYEFMHIQDPEKKDWIKKTLEIRHADTKFGKEEKLHILKTIKKAEMFEGFLHKKFIGHKRFSLEGSEAVIAMLDKLIDHAHDDGQHTVVIGMAHRGRLNVLANNIGKPVDKIFDEFEGNINPDAFLGSGDVKYHLGDHGSLEKNGRSMDIILAPNPSHLELVDPVVEGMVRALDDEIKDKSYTNVLPVLLHGDSAFAGQGIVAETLNLSQLEGYRTGGTVHIIINNQIGFTTTSQFARSSVYATDVAKMVHVPILHVNGNDPEAVVSAVGFALEYRKKFHTDVIIDMLCYRKYGHNESDEPSYTQPLLYKKIKKMKLVSDLYINQLMVEGSIEQAEADKIHKDINDYFEEHFQKRRQEEVTKTHDFILSADKLPDNLGLSAQRLQEIASAITSVPQGFNVNNKLQKLLGKRSELSNNADLKMDWAMAESLAFSTILMDGYKIRFTGQDSQRGTFSQRHVVLTDMYTEDKFTPLNKISQDQAQMQIFDSPLSEVSVLGFEYGYSVMAKRGLTIWEAQFGDFSNGAQPIIDQFISCAEQKWQQTSNLIMLLPHSYDGQGPEHSSARLERYLQLCAQDNMIVCNLSTPAQYYNVLRRHAHMKIKKPMVIMTPKSMLRHPQAVSSINELTEGKFFEIMDDNTINGPDGVKAVLMCSGKIYYDLLQKKQKEHFDNIAIVRFEQLYPIDKDSLSDILGKYLETGSRFAWVQEEPANMGAWSFVRSYLYDALKSCEINYIGRAASAATATGSAAIHNREQKEIIERAFALAT